MAEFASASTAAAAPAEDREIVLISGDGDEFRVSIKVSSMSNFVKTALEGDDDEADEEKKIPVPNVKTAVLSKVLEFCNQYVKDPMTDFTKPLQDPDLSILVQEFYADFITATDNDTLYNLTMAANFLDIKPLLDLCCARIASFIKNKTPEEIRVNLGIVCDFTPEEEAVVRAENAWAEDLH